MCFVSYLIMFLYVCAGNCKQVFSLLRWLQLVPLFWNLLIFPSWGWLLFFITFSMLLHPEDLNWLCNSSFRPETSCLPLDLWHSWWGSTPLWNKSLSVTTQSRTPPSLDSSWSSKFTWSRWLCSDDIKSCKWLRCTGGIDDKSPPILGLTWFWWCALLQPSLPCWVPGFMTSGELPSCCHSFELIFVRFGWALSGSHLMPSLSTWLSLSEKPMIFFIYCFR